MTSKALLKKSDKEMRKATPVATSSKPVVVPEYRIFTRDDSFEITAAMPGVSEKNLEVQLEDSWLSIKGQSEEINLDGFNKLYAEFTTPNYECGFKLPNGIDGEGISASLVNGMLKIKLPKAKEHRRHTIAVTAS